MSVDEGVFERFIRFNVRHRLAAMVVVLIFTVAFSLGAFKIKTDVILQDLFPHEHPYLQLHAKFSQIFGSGGSGVVIAVNAKEGDIFNKAILSKIKNLTEEIELWDEVYRALTVSMASYSTKVIRTKARGEIKIEPLMYHVPETYQEIEMLKRNLFSNPAYLGTLVSTDGTAALISTEMKENISYERIFNRLRTLVEKYSDEDISIHIVGFPMLMGWIYNAKTQMRVVFFVSIGLMILILYLIFRNFTGMIAPILVGLISTGIGLGFVGWTGINFSPLLFVLAFLVGARKISHAVQVTHRYMEELAESNNDKEKACYQTMHAMIMPNVAGVVTDAAGFLVLFLAKIVLMQHIAIIMSFWMLSIAFSAVLTPIICTFIPMKQVSAEYSKQRTKMDWFDKINMAAARLSMGSGRYVVVGAIILILITCAWQVTRLKIGDPTPGSPLLWPDHTYNMDQELINKKFKASSENFALYYEGEPDSVYDPIVLKTFAQFSNHMAEKLPDIYKSSSSIINITEMVNMTVHDGDWYWYQLPRDEVWMTGLLGHLRTRAGTGTLLRFIDKERERSQVILFFADHISENILRIKEAAYDFFTNHPMKTDKGEFKLAGGRIGMEIAVNDEMKRSHLLIDSMVLATIFIMCSLCFRSSVAGLMLTIPLILANLVAFAYMVMTNIGLSINTLPIAAVGVGVGVDFAIYIYSRIIEEYPEQDGWEESVMTAVRTSGKAVVYTGLTLVLAIIPWHFISDLKFQAQMGFFLSMLLMTNVVLALTLHPFLIKIIKPKFIKRRAAAVANGALGV